MKLSKKYPKIRFNNIGISAYDEYKLNHLNLPKSEIIDILINTISNIKTTQIEYYDKGFHDGYSGNDYDEDD